MENLIETLKNTVAFLMAIRIAVFIGLIILIARVGYSLFTSQEMKRFWHERKRSFIRFTKEIMPH